MTKQVSAYPTRIYFEDYSIPNPDLLIQVCENTYSRIYYSATKVGLDDTIAMTKRDLSNLIAGTEAFLHFALHPSGLVIKQLREVRGALQHEAS